MARVVFVPGCCPPAFVGIAVLLTPFSAASEEEFLSAVTLVLLRQSDDTNGMAGIRRVNWRSPIAFLMFCNIPV